MILLYTDGAAKGNPGPAGAGYWAQDASGKILIEAGVPLGIATNNEAEYRALLLGLEALLAAGYAGHPLEVRTDSELMAYQISGRYKLKAEHLRPLLEKARALLARFPQATVVAVPRRHNARADQLASAAARANPESS